MMDIESLKNKLPQIFFDEWSAKDILNKWVKIHIHDFGSTKVILIKNREYYPFYGYFPESNPFRVSPKANCHIWISKHSFEQEIVRHVCFRALPMDRDLEFEMRRVGRFKIEIRNVSLMTLGDCYKEFL